MGRRKPSEQPEFVAPTEETPVESVETEVKKDKAVVEPEVPTRFEKVVKTKDGVEKTVVANSEEELKEAVAAVKKDQAPVAPDINNPADANKIVSPENTQS